MGSYRIPVPRPPARQQEEARRVAQRALSLGESIVPESYDMKKEPGGRYPPGGVKSSQVVGLRARKASIQALKYLVST